MGPGARPTHGFGDGGLPLEGRVALVTGASRRAGIGFATACRLAGLGASVVLHHHRPHDEAQAWGADDLAAVVAGVRERLVGPGARVVDVAADLAAPDAPSALIDRAVAEFGHLDALICNHARSAPDGPLGTLDAEILDGHWAVDARSCILLAQAFAAAHGGRPGASIVFMTSGQALGPMPQEIAYATAKAALAGITPTLADHLADRGIRLNTVNPGPVDTGYVTDELHAATEGMFPAGRWGRPEDPARLIAWLCTDDAAWITGQVINSEGGFSRTRR